MQEAVQRQEYANSEELSIVSEKKWPLFGISLLTQEWCGMVLHVCERHFVCSSCSFNQKDSVDDAHIIEEVEQLPAADVVDELNRGEASSQAPESAIHEVQTVETV